MLEVRGELDVQALEVGEAEGAVVGGLVATALIGFSSVTGGRRDSRRECAAVDSRANAERSYTPAS